MRTESRGPGPDLIETRPTKRKTSDGEERTTEWLYRYYVDRSAAHYQTPRIMIRSFWQWVQTHSLSWIRAGIWVEETTDRSQAIVVVRYVEPGMTCGTTRNAAGCAQRNYFRDGTDLIRMAANLIATPMNPQGRQKGILHETAHLMLDAQHPGGGPREDFGIMGGDLPGDPRWPVDNDIISAKRFLAGGKG